MARILLVEDETRLAGSIRAGLRDELHVVDVALDGREGMFAAVCGEYDVIVLDWMLPHTSGLDICRRVREEGLDVPILVLTARDRPTDAARILDAGADDHVRKPFAFEELVARIRALLRRRSTQRAAVWEVGPLTLDPARHRVTWEDREVRLTPKEFQLLEALVRARGSVLSKGQLSRAAWEDDDEPDSNVVEVYIAALRRKLHPRLIRTVRGVGYALEAP